MNQPTSFVVSFPREDFPFLEATAIVARNGTAWFDIDTAGIRLSALGDELGLVRQLSATIWNGAADLPPFGFGVVPAELPSLVKKARTERWASLDINITPQDETGTVTQDRIVLVDYSPTGTLFPELLDQADLDRTFLTLSWQRPSAIDQLSPSDGEADLHVGALQECLSVAEKLLPSDADQPDFQLLELHNGIAHGRSLNLQFYIEAPTLKTVDLRLMRSQVRPLARLLSVFDRLHPHRASTTSQHQIFTDKLTTFYATLPAHRHPKSACELPSRLNTEALLPSAAVRHKMENALRNGRGGVVRNQVLRMLLTDDEPPHLYFETYSWAKAKRLNTARLSRIRSETSFDALTERLLVEKVFAVCNGDVAAQRDPEWLYFRSSGPWTQLTARVRAFPTGPCRGVGRNWCSGISGGPRLSRQAARSMH